MLRTRTLLLLAGVSGSAACSRAVEPAQPVPSGTATPALAAPASAAAPAVTVSRATPAGPLPTRVQVDAEASVISPDPDNKVIDAIIAHRDALDACLDGLPALIEVGADHSIHLSVGKDGHLKKIEIGGPTNLSRLDEMGECARRLLQKIDFGPYDKFVREGFIPLKADHPFVPAVDPDADSVTFTKTEAGIELVAKATRQSSPGDGYGLRLDVTVTNRSTRPRGFRKYFVDGGHGELRNQPPAKNKNYGTLSFDESSAITCVQPGGSFQGEIKWASSDYQVFKGGRLRFAPEVIFGDCEKPRERIHIGGFRLDWTGDTDRPNLLAIPYWISELDPIDPRQVFR